MTPQEPSYDEVEYAHVSDWGTKSYFVSSDGRLFRIMEVTPSYAKGYGILATFCSIVGKKYRTIHSIVAEAFIGPRPAGLHINHIDGNKRNNSVSNLEYLTPSENTLHAWRIGLAKGRGHKYYSDISPKSQMSQRKVSTDDAIEMIRLFREGVSTKAELSRRYNVSPQTVGRVINGTIVYKELPR